MVRSIVAVIVTYVVMAILIMGAFTGLLFGFGLDGLLLPGSFKGNMFLCIAAPTITVVVGLFGGWMCAKIGRGRGPVMALACVVLVVGLVTAYFILQKPFPADPRPANMTMEEFMKVGREPTWVALFNPIGGAAAVLIGGVVLAGRGAARRVG